MSWAPVLSRFSLQAGKTHFIGPSVKYGIWERMRNIPNTYQPYKQISKLALGSEGWNTMAAASAVPESYRPLPGEQGAPRYSRQIIVLIEAQWIRLTNYPDRSASLQRGERVLLADAYTSN